MGRVAECKRERFTDGACYSIQVTGKPRSPVSPNSDRTLVRPSPSWDSAGESLIIVGRTSNMLPRGSNRTICDVARF